MLSLDEREWEVFTLEDIFDILPGKRLEKRNMIAGDRPFIGASDSNNGLTAYCGNVNESLDRNVLGINYNGSVCEAFYHAYECIFSDDVKRFHLKHHEDNKLVLLFMGVVIRQQKVKYQYAYKFNEQRMRRQVIMLPVTDDGQPDYQFMEDYVRELMSAKREQYRQYVEKRLESLELDMANRGGYSEELKSREWKPILISAIFDLVRGRENNMAMLDMGDTPLVSAKNGNNGLKGFVNTPKKVISGHCITLNNDGDGGAGLAYYQPANMALDTHVTALVPKMEMSQWTMLFISECLSVLHGFFGHGLSISNDRAKNIKIMLPVTDDGQPDYEFMEEFGRKMMSNKYSQYLSFLALSTTTK